MPAVIAFIPELIAAAATAAEVGAPLELASATMTGMGVFGSLGAAVAGGSLLSSVSGLALSVGLSYAANMLTSGRPSQPSQTSQTTVNESTAPRTRVYGRAMVGGARFIWQNVYYVTTTDFIGSNFSGRVSVLAHCQGPIDAIEQYWFSDEVGTFSAAPNFNKKQVLTPMGGLGFIHSMKGTGSQAVMSELVDVFSSFWGTNDRARGLCYTAAFYYVIDPTYYTTYYKSAEPFVRVVMRGSLVWDPRVGGQNPDDTWDNPTTWTWSDNPALCILDFLRHPDGRDKPRARIDVQSFIDFANLCDQTVSLKHGGTEKRYRLCGTYNLTDEPGSIQRRMLATCDGELYRTPDGLIGIRGGQWVAPTLTFQGDAILEYSLSQGTGKLSAFNDTTITYTSPDHDYQAVEADPWINAASQAVAGDLPTSLELDMVPSNGQARRLAKINDAKGNPAWRGSITLDVTGLNAITERMIRVTLPSDDLGIDETFLISKYSVSPDFTRVTLDVVSLHSTAYAWDPASEEGEAPPIAPTVEVSPTIPDPTGLALSVNTSTYGGVLASSINVSVTPPTDPTLRMLVQYAPTGTSNWISDLVAAGVWSFDTGVVAVGTYDVQVRFISTTTLQGNWTAISSITVASTSTAPGQPTALSASNASGTVTLGATAPNSSTVADVVFWRTSGATFSGATRLSTVYCAPNQVVVATDHPGTGTWRYWATAENSGGAASAATGPQTVTV